MGREVSVQFGSFAKIFEGQAEQLALCQATVYRYRGYWRVVTLRIVFSMQSELSVGLRFGRAGSGRQDFAQASLAIVRKVRLR
jgi:hypothetical protein